MPVTILQKDYWDLVYEAQRQKNLNHNDRFPDARSLAPDLKDTASHNGDAGSHRFDVTYQYPEQLGQGTYREIQLRQGIELAIDRYYVHDNFIKGTLLMFKRLYRLVLLFLLGILVVAAIAACSKTSNTPTKYNSALVENLVVKTRCCPTGKSLRGGRSLGRKRSDRS